MKLIATLALLASILLCSVAQAEERVTLGWGRLFTNDAIGDLEDRWHTGSYTVSRLRGYNWSGALPKKAGRILEFRFVADTVAPSNLLSPAASDRRYAGSLTFSAATHFDLHGFDATYGGGATIIGPATGLGLFQSKVHEFLNLDAPTTVLDDQIPNQILPYATAEIARSLDLSDLITLRPYLAGQAGAEDLLRIGGDLILGRMGKTDLLLRDTTTGHLFRGISGDAAAQFSLVLGVDLARVFDSVYLPDGGVAVMTESRHRLRVGYLWQGKKATVFSGLTYLSPEFDGQSEGQIVGSLSLNFTF
jgi:hypothetical protein